MSERSVYAIASGKGGVGKTTTAINLGAMLADRGHEVVVVDTDLGMANLADFLEFEIGSPTLQEVLAGDADAEDAIHRAPGGIDVLPTATDIEAFARSDPANLDGVVADLRDEYDYVLLDTGAGVSYDVLVPLALADGVLLVATPDVASVRDTAKTGELAARVESEVVGAVLTQRSSDILSADDVEETLGTDVIAVVPEDEAVPMGIDAGRPLAAFAPNAPAGQAYRELAGVLTGEADPDPELDLGSDANVDAAFDADPPRKATDSEPTADRQTGKGAATSGDAIGADDSGGLLGGELAKAADEIRKQADRPADKDSSASADSREGNSHEDDVRKSDSREGDGDGVEPTETAAGDPAEGTTADPTDESDARSVDDLLDEHMGDRQPGGDGSSGDPLAGMDDDPFGDDSLAGTGGDSSDASEESPDPLGAEGSSETGSSSEAESKNGGDGEDGEGATPSAESDRKSEDVKSEDVTSRDVEAGDGEAGGVKSGDVESGDAEADGVKTGTLGDEDDDGSGVLGRLGSLFK